MPSRSRPEVPKDQLRTLSAFRHSLRRFLRFSEDAARESGITVLQYQLLLHVAGFDGREWATVGELAQLLQARPNGVVALVTRCEEAGLVRRRPGTQDRRQVEVHLTPKGRKRLSTLAVLHREELELLADAIDAARAEIGPARPREPGKTGGPAAAARKPAV